MVNPFFFYYPTSSSGTTCVIVAPLDGIDSMLIIFYSAYNESIN